MLKTLKRKLLLYLSDAIAQLQAKALAEKNRQMLKQLKSCGKGVYLHGNVTIVSPENVELHENVHIGNNAYLDGRGGITIAENTHISRNFVVHSSNHHYQGIRLPYDDTYRLKPVVIERNVWIGTNVVVVPGIRIGEGAIIGAGTVVTKDVPPLAVIGNQPQRIIKYRDKIHYEKLDLAGAYGGVSGRPISRSIR